MRIKLTLGDRCEMMMGSPHRLQVAGAGPCGQRILGSIQIPYGVTLSCRPVDLGVCHLRSKDTGFLSRALSHLTLTEAHELRVITVNIISILELN